MPIPGALNNVTQKCNYLWMNIRNSDEKKE